jgi:hypothetical protein
MPIRRVHLDVPARPSPLARPRDPHMSKIGVRVLALVVWQCGEHGRRYMIQPCSTGPHQCECARSDPRDRRPAGGVSGVERGRT